MGRKIRDQRYVYVDEWDEVTPGFADIHIELAEEPDEIWTYRFHTGNPELPPRGWIQVCSSCEKEHGPEAQFCPSCGSSCSRKDLEGPFAHNRHWGYWLDKGHDWSWRNGKARVNNAGASSPGFWLVLTYYEK